ncbi:hypothetical protein [Paucilactobacillus hokkaidonensis]|uniref:hypothetical protein n=1 Tax=Paucilactobacillus hokkaidonensis TaxID=1193095 RepID=UPI0034E2B55A
MLLTIVVSDISYASFSNHYLTAIIHGSSFYMYYLLVTLQLYLVFPGIVWLFKKWPNAHKRIVVISFFVQIILVSLIKFKFANMDTGSWPYWFKSYSINVFFISILFYFRCVYFAALSVYGGLHSATYSSNRNKCNVIINRYNWLF